MALAMIIKILLSSLLALLALFVTLQRTSSRGVRFTVLAMLAIGAYFVWRPEHATAVAQTLGVGRGADLLMYLWVVITCSVILLLYLKIVHMNRMLTELARRLALGQPMHPPDRSRASDGPRDRRGAHDDSCGSAGGGTTARQGPI
jgi:small membrane protein